MNLKLIGLAIVVFALGCGSSTSSYLPENYWPTKEAAEQLVARPLPTPEKKPKLRAVFVQRWALVGDMPTMFGYSKPQLTTAWENGVNAVVTKHPKHRLTAAAMCVAQQVGAFVPAHDNTFPGKGLQSFIGARCGMTANSYAIAMTSYDQGDDPDAKWNSKKVEITKWLEGRINDSVLSDHGVAAIVTPGRLSFVLVSAERVLDIDAAPFIQSGSVVIRGNSNMPNTGSISATITKGEFGFSACERDSRISFPKFAFTCPVDSSDPFATIDFSVSREGRMLGSISTNVLVASATPPQEYLIPAIRRAISAAPVTEEEQATAMTGTPIVETNATLGSFSADVVRVVNHVRKQAGFEPVTLAVEQSLYNSKIAPFMFSDAAKTDVDTENETTLAVLAGWNVEGFILDGGFQMSTIKGVEPSAFVDSVLESASGRALLLGPGVSTLAVGTAPVGDNIGVVASTYDFLPTMDFNKRVGEALRDLNRKRAQRNLPALKESIKLRGIARETATRIERNDMDLDAAGEKMAEQYVLKYNKGCRYWRLVVNDFDDMDFAKEIVETQKGRVSILVAPYRPEGYAWGYYAVVIVVEN